LPNAPAGTGGDFAPASELGALAAPGASPPGDVVLCGAPAVALPAAVAPLGAFPLLGAIAVFGAVPVFPPLGSTGEPFAAEDGASVAPESAPRVRKRPNVSKNAAPMTIMPSATSPRRRTPWARALRESSEPASPSLPATLPPAAVQLTRVRPLGADCADAASLAPLAAAGIAAAGMAAPWPDEKVPRLREGTMPVACSASSISLAV